MRSAEKKTEDRRERKVTINLSKYLPYKTHVLVGMLFRKRTCLKFRNAMFYI